MSKTWRDHCHTSWADALEPVAGTLTAIEARLDLETQAGRPWLPHPDAVMRAFETPVDDVRVLIVGQDPYPTPGDAVGLSFSVATDRPMPRSLTNIARELRDDTGEALASGDLSAWQAQGVMLLNRVLTVGEGDAGSHRGMGWEQVTDHAIRTLAARGGPLVAVLWGKDAQRLAPLLGDVPVIASPHPSPLSARRGFFGSRPFSRVNAELIAQGGEPLSWGTSA
ncbi:uracil-DNA glycosylase [Demequina flava]|uniref:uracil-DNA glycosylase n=1 Tax=Demequina flava TaxID=1095025 RepID=UPI0007801CD0|nr:uracil-DNA glycosylase [Demequina flava]